MGVDTEFFSRNSVKRKGTEHVAVNLRQESAAVPLTRKSARNFVFGVLFPGLFVGLVYYHFFFYFPDTSQFYVKLLERCFRS